MKRKAFPLRLRPEVYQALRKWADDDLRSVNAQIEFILQRALASSGRWTRGQPSSDEDEPAGDEDEPSNP